MFLLASAVFLPVSGWVADRFGAKRIFMVAMILFALSSAACGFANNLGQLVLARMFQGMAGAMMAPVGRLVLLRTTPKSELVGAMSVLTMPALLGPVIGPPLGGFIVTYFDWRWIFYINLPFGLVALLLANHYLPNSRFKQAIHRVDWIGILLLAVGIGALQIMLERGEHEQWFDSHEIQALAAITALSLVAFVWHELRTAHPVVDFSPLRDAQFSASIVFSFLLGMALFGTIFYLPLYLQSLLNYNAWETGLVILPGAIASGVTMAVMGKTLARLNIDLRWIAILGVAIFGVSMYQHQAFTTESGHADFFWPLIWRGVGLGMLFVPLNALAMARIAPEQIAGATGLYTLIRQLGGSVGIAAAATQFSHLQATFKADISLSVSELSQSTRDYEFMMQQLLTSKGVNHADLPEAMYRLLDAQMTAQASMIAFEHLFSQFSLALVFALPLLLLMPTAKNLERFGGGDH